MPYHGKQPLQYKKGIPKVRIPVSKGKLSRFGYSTSKSDIARHRVLNKAIKKYGALNVYQKLKAQVTLRKNAKSNTKKGKTRTVFNEDADWVKQNFDVDGFVNHP
jgi:hypothetical protein